jgi:Ni/Co efflux regulator RcnB
MTVATVAATKRALPALVGLALVVAAPSASASNASLKQGLAKWSHTVALDARRVDLSAQNRHPRRMTTRAQRFRHDALRARRALASQGPSTAKGRRAKGLSLAAFRAYAVVGQQWALTGKARLQHRKALAASHSRIAKRFALRGNRLLIAAARLLR